MKKKILLYPLLSVALLTAPLVGQKLEVFTGLSLPQVDLVVRELESTIGAPVVRAGYAALTSQHVDLAV